MFLSLHSFINFGTYFQRFGQWKSPFSA